VRPATRRCTGYEAWRALHDLTDYLNTAHRLTLQQSKTRIHLTLDFVCQELDDPEEQEKAGKLAALKDAAAVIAADTGYDVEIDELPPSYSSEASIEALTSLFASAVGGKYFRLGLARHLLRRGKQLHSRCLNSLVLANLPTLAPCLGRSLSTFLQRCPRSRKSD